MGRIERDSLGERQIPVGAYYGVQTVRAVENFPFTGLPISRFPNLVKALGIVKEACALANMELGQLDPKIGNAIVAASREVQDGLLSEHFVVDMIQGGAGTSTNMNANEVIANRAAEILGSKKGDHKACHPNNHVNLSQSTNDVYPTALKLAFIASMQGLITALEELSKAFSAKGVEFKDVLKIGRTQMQDAVPMTLGQEFEAFAATILEDVVQLNEAITLLHEVNLGATAIGTGVNSVEGYTECVRQKLCDITGWPITTAVNLIEDTSDTGVFVTLSGVLKRIAVKLNKICNDLRLLSSGPRAGFGEISLPPMQPGSSIMPGKVNPVIPEVVNQVCYQVIGNDVVVSMGAQGGQLQLNAFEPVIAFNIFFSMSMLRSAANVLREKCVVGIKANEEQCRHLLERSLAIATALVPILGYDEAARIANEALATNKTIRELAAEKLPEDQIDEILDASKMIRPKPNGHRCGG